MTEKKILTGRTLDLFTVLGGAILVGAIWLPRMLSERMITYWVDPIEFSIPHLVYSTRAFSLGRIPHWCDSIFGGYPFLSDPQAATFFPPYLFGLHLPKHIINTTTQFEVFMVFYQVAAGAGMIALCLSLGCQRLPSLVGGITFGLSGFMLIKHSQTVVTSTVAFFLWATAFVVLAVRRCNWHLSIMAGFFGASAILAGHWQTALLCLYSALAIGVVLSIEQIRTKQLSVRFVGKGALFVMMACLIAIGLSLLQVLPTITFLLNSPRQTLSFEMSCERSLPKSHVWALFMPNIYAATIFTQLFYVPCWAIDNPYETYFYVGLAPVLVACVLLLCKKPTFFELGLLLIVVLGIFAAMGKDLPLYRIAYDILPGFKQGRMPPRLLLCSIMALSILLAKQLTYISKLLTLNKGSVVAIMSFLLILAGGLFYYAYCVSQLNGPGLFAHLENYFHTADAGRLKSNDPDFIRSAVVQQVLLSAGIVVALLVSLGSMVVMKAHLTVRILQWTAFCTIYAELLAYGYGKDVINRCEPPKLEGAIIANLTEKPSGRIHKVSRGTDGQNGAMVSESCVTGGYNPLVPNWIGHGFPVYGYVEWDRECLRRLVIWNCEVLAVEGKRDRLKLPGKEGG